MKLTKNEQKVTRRTNVMDGAGEVVSRHFLPMELAEGAGRLFAVDTLAPGASIGYHTHENEFELYYVISGVATVEDNGEKYELFPGDMMKCAPGGWHGIANCSNEDMEFMALILNTK